MAGVEPYSPCPCGSGQKFKWCCQKIESYADKSRRLYEGGQVDAALQALDEGLKKAPDNPWLSARKAMILMEEDRAAEALPILRQSVARHPESLGGQALLIQAVLATEGPRAVVGQVQQALTAIQPDLRPALVPFIQSVGLALAQDGLIPAAIAHLHLVEALDQSEQSMVSAIAARLESDPETSPWLREPYSLSPAPEGLDPDRAARFQEAIDWAATGLWGSAAAGFATLSDNGSLPEAERNLALCRLWLADEAAAAEALGRYVEAAGDRPDVVEMESLRQLITPAADEDQLDAMQLTWSIRDRQLLLANLEAAPRCHFVGREPIDPDHPESASIDHFWLLDRPRIEAEAVKAPADIPRVVAEMMVGPDKVMLNGVDDGGLDSLGDLFTNLAGPSIPPAHPKTKRVGKVPRSLHRIDERWAIPRGLDSKVVFRLLVEDLPRLLRQVWAKTPMPYLDGRTPEQAVRDGDAMVPLRAALNIIEYDRTTIDGPTVVSDIRKELGIPAEPAVDPASVDVIHVPMGRLHTLPVEQLDDHRLLITYLRARESRLLFALERAATEITRRPALCDGEALPGVDRVAVYGDLATLAQGRRDNVKAREFAKTGRDGGNPAHRAEQAPGWDLLDLRIAIDSSAPEAWVPDLVVLMDRYRENPRANERIMGLCAELGLLRMVPDPDSRGGMLVDPRPLQVLIERYGPRITTASGRLGVTETAGGIWTPEKEAASRGGSAIWTPGSTASPPPTNPDRPDSPPSKLIITGS